MSWYSKWMMAGVLVGMLSIPPAPAEASPRQAAQEYVSGLVTSEDDGRPVAGARVSVEGHEASGFTDAVGRFRLGPLPEGEHTVVVERLGFHTEWVEVRLPGADASPVSLRVSLRSDPLLVEGLVVSAAGELRRRAETPVSVGRIEGERIRAMNPSHPAEVMNRMPGVWVSPTTTEGHMTAIRQPITTKPVYLFLEDGVPTRSPGFFNHNALYEVNLPQADRIEVIRGPGTSLYGSDAIGGVIDVGTRPSSPDPQIETTLEGSTRGYGRVLLSGSGAWGGDGLRLDLNVTDGESWREGATYERQSATVRWDRALAGGYSLSTTATWSSIDQGEASSLSEEELHAAPTRNYHPIAYRRVKAFRAASHLERRMDRSLLRVTPFLRWNELDLMPSWMLNFDPVVYTSGHSTGGLMTRYHRDLPVLQARITLGADVERSPGSRAEDRIAVTWDGDVATGWERGERLYDYDAVFTGVSPYAQLALAPLPWVHLTGGLRWDRFGFDYRTALDPVQEGSHRRPPDSGVHYSNLAPSIGIALTPAPELNVFASFRESFRAPSEGQLFRQGPAESTLGLEPVKARSVEVGARGDLDGRLGWEISFYRMEVRDDILTWIRPEDGLRESLNAGRTRHRGVELGLGAALPAGFEGELSFTRASHRYVEWSPRPGLDYAGNRMEQAPRELATVRLRRAVPVWEEGTMELEWVRMGRFWMDPENLNAYGGHDLWNLRFEIPVVEGLAVSGRVANLADRVYAERASHHPRRGGEFSPGAPRTLHLALRYRWAR